MKREQNKRPLHSQARQHVEQQEVILLSTKITFIQSYLKTAFIYFQTLEIKSFTI